MVPDQFLVCFAWQVEVREDTVYVRLFEILEDEIRICLSLLGVTGYHELDKSYTRPARQVVTPHVHSVFPHLNLPRETY